MFQGDPEFVSVGIGPLSVEGYKKFVEADKDPHESLKGDLRFLAQRMHVECPPLPVQSQAEFRIYNDFMRKCKKPKAADWVKLAIIYKEKCDYKTVFPKLPSMLKSYYKKWEKNSLIKQARSKIKGPYKELLKTLGAPSNDTPANVQPEHMQPPMESAIEFPGSEEMDALMGEPKTVVPPLAAPGQAVAVSVPPLSGGSQTCADYCGCLANVCGGWKSGQCARINSGEVARKSEEELAQARAERNRQRKQESAARRRKRAKNNTT